jgi:hypothetical protein
MASSLALVHTVYGRPVFTGVVEDSTIHNASEQFASCAYFYFVDFAFNPSPQTKI